ncbi:MAG: succinyl-diaminopimelate desuccinylase [Rhodobiaceae bacterium]|nr:succinyl-diaminopimelate desuccinylase [Rhodobiaceae bacterium]
MIYDPLELTSELIRCRSITPNNDGAIELLSEKLENIGFNCKIIEFTEEGTEPIKNLWAQIGKQRPCLSFAGHTDVVPVADEDSWTSPPFEGRNDGNIIIGRGAADMKGSIGSFVSAVSTYLDECSKEFKGSITFIITGDEEGVAINGTCKLLEWMENNGHKFDDCIVGEPTNPNKLGEMIKIGRRGSTNITIKCNGTEGHVAYPDLADNPIPKLVKLLNELIKQPLDDGNEYFDASNLELTSIDTGNFATNVIPSSISASLNVRYNDTFDKDKIEKEVLNRLNKTGYDNFDVSFQHSGDSFITEPGKFVNDLKKIIKKHCDIKPVLSTTGGTSDARFIKDYGRVVEFGLVGKSMHKIDEYSNNNDIIKLRDIYLDVLRNYFS